VAAPIAHVLDVKQQRLDANETYIRDVHKVNIENRARFRHTIGLDLHAENLQSAIASIDELGLVQGS
jgi:hypothetical protein